MNLKLLTALTTALFFCYNLGDVQALSGNNVCWRTTVRYVQRRICVYRFWRSCCRYKTISICVYQRVQKCCAGWAQRGDRCDQPICEPQCYNGGTCTSPNKCSCRTGIFGDLCTNIVCAYEKPCYPGICGNKCTCRNKHSGESCLQLGPTAQPDITTASAVMSVIDTKNYDISYSVRTNASLENGVGSEIFWTNLPFFNQLNVSWDSMYESEEDYPPRPSYVHDFKFGIAQAEVNVLHSKRDKGKWIVASNITVPCTDNAISSSNPEEGILPCRVDTGRFLPSLEHEDMLDIKVRSKNGGIVTLVKTGAPQKIKEYSGIWKEKEMKFRFDFRKPFHCVMNTTCRNLPISVDGSDIRKTGFTMRWPGWEDSLSGIDRYIWRVFLLRPNVDGNLMEDGAPVAWQQANGTNAGSATASYTPGSPGMYSVYLQVSDKANNSEYARALVLYDPSSQVEINNAPEAKLFVSSASAEVDFQWQTNLTTPIVVSWKNHFRNPVHEDNKLLNQVRSYSPERFIGKIGDRDYVDDKGVSVEYDDHKGDRTVDAIPNVHGMVKFEVAHRTDHALGESCEQPPNSWTEVSDPLAEQHVFNVTRQDGSTVCIWVRGSDVFKNSKTDMTVVSFDSTKPELDAPELERNVAPEGAHYLSRIVSGVRDIDSGIREVKWRMINTKNNEEFGSGSFNATRNEACASTSTECDCSPPNTNNCYNRNVNVYIPHCAINVSKSVVASLIVRVEIEAVNGAGLRSDIKTFELNNVTGLDGINKYVAPMQFASRDITTSSATITWDNPPSCYTLTAIQVAYRPVNGGQLSNYTSFRLSKDVSLNGLYRCTSYVMWIYNIYDTEVSDPSEHKFETVCYSASEIAGIVIGILLLLAVIALLLFILVLWRRGQLRTTLERRLTRARTILRNRVRRDSRRAVRTTYFNNMPKDDDLYVYGNMAFDGRQNWALNGADLDLQEILAEGRFARVYRAALLRAGASPQTVAAKMLLPTKAFDENERLLMNAKINFMASNDLQHANVIHFVGAINDDVERGPIMLLEFCEMGTLKNWLSKQRTQGRVSEDVVDRLFHIVFEVAQGMEYLASKEIVHRKLAARNILLDFSLHPKIIGFGPVPDELTDEADNSKGERLPLKWMAVELVKAKSTKNSSEKTDVWSYGVVVWEVFSLGEAPYSKIKGSELSKKLTQGYRLPRPEFMTDEYDMLTKRCWNQMPEDRPSFVSLVKEQSALFDSSGKHSSYYDSSHLKNYY